MLTLWKGSDPEPDPNWDKFQDQEQNIMNLDPQPSPETNIFFIKQNAMGYLPRFHWSESRHPSRPPAARAVGIPRLRPGPAWPRLPGSYREKLRVRFSQITCLACSVWRFLSKRTWRSVLQSRSFFWPPPGLWNPWGSEPRLKFCLWLFSLKSTAQAQQHWCWFRKLCVASAWLCK